MCPVHHRRRAPSHKEVSKNRLKKIIFLAVSLLFSVAVYANGQPTNNHNHSSRTIQSSRESRQPSWVSDIINISGILVAAGMIVWQLGRQHKNALEIQKWNYRERLRLKIYQQFAEALQSANHDAADAGMYAYLIPVYFSSYVAQKNVGVNVAPIISRAVEFRIKDNAAATSLIKIITLIERYEIIGPQLDVFQVAINAAIHEMREAFQPLHSVLLEVLPVDFIDPTGNRHVTNVVVPTQDQLKRLEQLVTGYHNATNDAGCYLFDLNVELQNVFLGELFENKVEKRAPIDPAMKVITTDPEEAKKLRKYFEEETAWGRSKREADRQARQSISERTGGQTPG